jgi:hypothetical protein
MPQVIATKIHPRDVFSIRIENSGVKKIAKVIRKETCPV